MDGVVVAGVVATGVDEAGAVAADIIVAGVVVAGVAVAGVVLVVRRSCGARQNPNGLTENISPDTALWIDTTSLTRTNCDLWRKLQPPLLNTAPSVVKHVPCR